MRHTRTSVGLAGSILTVLLSAALVGDVCADSFRPGGQPIALRGAPPTPTRDNLPNGALPPSHLYIGAYSEVDRYPLVNGIVQPSPDARLTSVSRPATIAWTDGELYATYPVDGAGGMQVYAYSTPDLTLLRTLDVPAPDFGASFQFTALAVDARNYLYVGWVSIEPHSCAGGVYVYAPFASGQPQPLVSIPIKYAGCGGVWGLALDAQGNLYVARSDRNAILIYSSPSSNPTLIGSIFGPQLLSPIGLRIDANGELYVGCAPGSNPKPPYALAYHITGPGRARLDRKITPAGAQHGGFGEYVAIFGNYLFLNTLSGVDQLDKLAKGVQTPLAQISNNKASTLSIGP
jgi:hypothetical protein